MVEYALLVSVIALVAFASLTLVGDRTEETFEIAGEALSGEEVSGSGVNLAGGSDDSDDQSGGNNDTGDTGGSNDDQNGGGNDTGGTAGSNDGSGNAGGDQQGEIDDESLEVDQGDPDDGAHTSTPWSFHNDDFGFDVTGSDASIQSWGSGGRWVAEIDFGHQYSLGKAITFDVVRIHSDGSTTTHEITHWFHGADSTYKDGGMPNFAIVAGDIQGVVGVEFYLKAVTINVSGGPNQTIQIDDPPAFLVSVPDLP